MLWYGYIQAFLIDDAMNHTGWDKHSFQFLFAMMNSVTENAKVIFTVFSIYMFLLIVQEKKP